MGHAFLGLVAGLKEIWLGSIILLWSISSLVALGQAAHADLVAGKAARLSEGLDGNFAAVPSL